MLWRLECWFRVEVLGIAALVLRFGVMFFEGSALLVGVLRLNAEGLRFRMRFVRCLGLCTSFCGEGNPEPYTLASISPAPLNPQSPTVKWLQDLRPETYKYC